MYQTIIVEKLENHVGLLRLNRPQALNALSWELMGEVTQALGELESDPEIGCCVITGNDKAFAAGADIKDLSGVDAVGMLRRDIAIWETLAALTKPIIAAVSGVCLGGGCELAMACDIIIASESARFGQPEINIGVIPGGGGTQRLTQIVGKYIAMEMVLNNRWLNAEEALRYGLVNHVHPVDVYLEHAVRIAGEIAGRAPIAVQLGKDCVRKSYEVSLAEGINYERRAFAFLFGTEDQKEGMQAFIEKREPTWKGK